MEGFEDDIGFEAPLLSETEEFLFLFGGMKLGKFGGFFLKEAEEGLPVILFIDFGEGFADAVIGDASAFQFAEDADAPPVFDAEFAAGEAAGEAFFVEEIIRDEGGYDFFQGITIDAPFQEFAAHFGVASVLKGAVALNIGEGLVLAQVFFGHRVQGLAWR